MREAGVVQRMAALPNLGSLPREELKWLVRHGQLESYGVGAVLAPKGERIERLWIVLSGQITVRVDRGAGPRLVIEWRAGDVSGMLPYSRMTGPPGDNVAEKPTEILSIHERHFPEIVHRCPAFTTRTVHMMLDRARSFNTSALQDEKMVSLGKLAAGLAHELNNPASATARGAKQLAAGLHEVDTASRALGSAALTAQQLDTIERMRADLQAKRPDPGLSPIEQAAREDEIAEWIERCGADAAYAPALAETAVTIESLDELQRSMPASALVATLRWLAARCAADDLAADIAQAATQIYELVAAVKQFTYMDNLAAAELVDVESGLHNTVRVLAAKAKRKGATIRFDLEPGLPRVHAAGGDLNQVWMNLIDNALDAIDENGSIDIEARTELDRVVVRVIDDGPGIPPEVMPRIFDAFFTTKPPGHGTGLGLDLAQMLVRRHRGEITVQSRPGRTAFEVNLFADGRGAPAGGTANGVSRSSAR